MMSWKPCWMKNYVILQSEHTNFMNERTDRLKKALVAINKLQSKLNEQESKSKEPIAIVGLGCRLPGGVENPEAFWELLRDGVDAATEVPSDRWNIDDYYNPDPDAPGKMYTRQANFLNNVDHFDAQFFGISPREAESMDPQQRLLLETTWEALEYAGFSPDHSLDPQTGVFVGVMSQDYSELTNDPELIDAHTGSGNIVSITAGRLSYLLGLRGPTMTVDTACSSSLAAVHLACQSLRLGESNLALAGGVNLILSPKGMLVECRAHMLSVDGRCKTFDAASRWFRSR